MLESAGPGNRFAVSARAERSESMSGTGWAISMAILYVVLVVTVAVITFRKGHWVLGLIGFVFPILWLIGAVLPSRRRYR
jgi:hypothetical protein